LNGRLPSKQNVGGKSCLSVNCQFPTRRLVISGTKKFDGWIQEVAEQLSQLLTLDIARNYESEEIT
jgi:hypothetical protein